MDKNRFEWICDGFCKMNELTVKNLNAMWEHQNGARHIHLGLWRCISSLRKIDLNPSKIDLNRFPFIFHLNRFFKWENLFILEPPKEIRVQPRACSHFSWTSDRKNAVNMLVLSYVAVSNSSSNPKNRSYFCLISSLSGALYSYVVASSLSGNRFLLVYLFTDWVSAEYRWFLVGH